MAAFDYPRAQATATRLIEKFGEACTLTRRTLPAVAPAEPWKGEGLVLTTHAVQMAFLPAKRTGRETVAVGATEQRKSSIVGYLSGTGLAFTVDGQCTVTRADGTVMRINNAKQTNPAGLTVYYEIEFDE